MTIIRLQTCDDRDKTSITEFLNHYKLVTQDFDFNKQLFIKLVKNNKLIATGGLELHRPYGLLRSIAVDPGHLKNGYATKICNALEDLAKEQKITDCYLLTETAVSFFSKLGFTKLERKNTPEAIKLTEQFSSLCPDTATVMYKRLIPLA